MKKRMIISLAAFSLVMTACGSRKTADKESSVSAEKTEHALVESDKKAAADFSSGTNIVITVGDFTFEVPAKWENKDNKTFYAEKGEGAVMFHCSSRSGDVIDDAVLEKEREAIIEAMTSDIDEYELLDAQTVTVNGIKTHGAMLDAVVNDTECYVELYWFANPESGGITQIGFFQSKASKYDHKDDFHKIVKSIKRAEAEKEPEITEEEEPEEETEAPAEEPENTAEEAGNASDFEEFKKKMDDIEAFFDSYAEFMKSYDMSDFSMMSQYMDMLVKYEDAMNALDAIDESELTPEEEDYYTKVMLRIDKKLIEAAEAMN